MTREVNRKSDILMIGVWISTQHNSCQRGDELLPAKNSLMGIDSPLTGAPSMISYLATVSVSVVVLGPEKEDKDFTTGDKILKWSKVSSTLSGTQLVYREKKKPGLKAERR